MSSNQFFFARSHADAADMQGEHAFNTLLDNLDGMVYRCRDDGDWTMEYVSDGCLRLTGYQPGDLLFNNRVSYESITHPEDRRRVRAGIHMAIAARRRYELEYRIIDSAGEERWVMERGAAVLDPSGRVVALEGIISDITRLKRTERAALEAEHRYRSLFDNSLEGIFRSTVDGHYIDVNPALARLYGFNSPQELVNCVSDIRQQLYVNPERREEFMFQVRTFGKVSRFESEVYRKDGNVIWISENARAIFDEQGRLTCFEGTVEDITEQKRYEQSLIEASEAAAAANKAKSAFLANVSHEIRTPMNGVIGMTELLLSTRMEPTQRNYVETIRSSADALLTVINDILDFSKIEAGKLDIDHVDMDLRGTVEDVANMMAFQAAAKNLELIVNISPEVPERVSGDPQRIRQCLVNLAGNAIKFTRSGEIVITVCTAGQRDGRVVTLFEVRDTGIGIAADSIGTLFEPFVQADSSTTRHFGGTGLGLSIVRRLVEMMGGEVGVSSEPGKGSTFWFTLPFEAVEVTGMLPGLKMPPQGGRVLVVDDNNTNRRVVAGHLQHVGYEVELASSGAQALSLLRQAVAAKQPFDVALVDLQMPDMDGATLGEHINADPQLSQARLVMLTSMDRQGDLQRFTSLGFAGYLAKPVRARELYACVERVLACESREWHTQNQPLVTRGALKEAAANQRFIGRVLVVEDNQVNQMVAKSFLERHGCVVILADNGAEGVKAYENGQFDLVFMDMQMPVMDGLTATRKIRDFEGWRPRTPIVALTANAMAGQAERCIAAGMDGFLTKPLESGRLREVLEQYLRRDDTLSATTATRPALKLEPEAVAVPNQTVDATSAGDIVRLMDWSRFEALMAGDREFALQLIDVFIDSAAQILSELRLSAGASDRQQLQRAAHKLKGASANICSDKLFTLCQSLEAAVANETRVQLTERVAEIVEVNAQTIEEMRQYLKALPL
ncbi:MAG: response regulator [Steroidobacteraceae bacterium]